MSRSIYIICLVILGALSFAVVHFGLQWLRTDVSQTDAIIQAVEGQVQSIEHSGFSESTWLIVQYDSDGESKRVKIPLDPSSSNSAPVVGDRLPLYFPSDQPSRIVTERDELIYQPDHPGFARLGLIASLAGWIACSLLTVWVHRQGRMARSDSPNRDV